MDEKLPKLRLMNPDSPEELARRFAKEQQAVQAAREMNAGVGNFRVGSVPYLNAVPLTRGLENQIVFAPPSELARRLQAGELDAALVSVTEVLFNDQYDVLDGIAVASLGEVKSVFLAHQVALEEVRVVHCDPASLTSVNLLRVLLAERGLVPEFKPLADYDFKNLPEATLLIGDRALEYLMVPHKHKIWDLGSAWYDMTRLPFVYAVWALRRGMQNTELRRELREARDFGLDTLDIIIRDNTQFDFDFRKDYLSWHIHYHLGSDEKRGLAKFIEFLRKHSDAPVFEPQFVS